MCSGGVTISHNIAAKDRLERDKINVDLAASGVAYRERLNLPVIPAQVEHQQPEELRDYFRERLAYYRNLSLKLPGGNDPVYHKEPKD
nr:DNA polymerase III subunit theta [Pantoea stewartii]